MQLFVLKTIPNFEIFKFMESLFKIIQQDETPKLLE